LKKRVLDLENKYNFLEGEILKLKLNDELKTKFENNTENLQVNKIEEILKKTKKRINLLKSECVNHEDFCETAHKRTPYCKRVLQPIQTEFELFCEKKGVNSSKCLEVVLASIPLLYDEFIVEEEDDILNLVR